MKYSHLIDRDDAESKHTIIMTHDYILFHCFVKLDVLCLALCFIQDVDRVFLFFFSQIFDRYRKQEELAIHLTIKQSSLEDLRKGEETRHAIGANKS